MVQEYFQKKVLIIGLGMSGISAARFLLQQKAFVWGIDQNYPKLLNNPAIEELRALGLQFVQQIYLPPLETFHKIVISPGVALTHPVLKMAKEHSIEILGEIEMAFRSLKNPLIGITGTNGKTTVTLLVTHILNESGINAKAVGNIGEPLSEEIFGNPKTVLVVELSSFQLETLTSPCLDAGVILNITPDHLDRYNTMEKYATAKMHIHRCLKPHGKLYMEERAYQTYGSLMPDFSPKLYGYTETSDLYTDLHHLYMQKNVDSMLPLDYRGSKSHILENLMATYGLCKELGIDAKQFWHGVSTFKLPPHRIEKIRTLEGVSYYNDSKGTNIDAVIRAVETLKGPVILIAGGIDKGTDFSPWIEAFADRVKHICVIGQAADKIAKTLSHQFTVHKCESLSDAVKCASSLAYPGDNVLLSPGCASFDMFENYAHRGIVFSDTVNALTCIQK